jgi:formylglycine-generating enzyme required for sulfatase activity
VASTSGDDPAALARRGGREWLSLALLEARNELLARLAALGEAPAAAHAWRLAARAGWFQEWWVARHVQRARGEAADASSPRLPGIEPRAEGWLHAAAPADAQAIRHYLGQTLEQTLELLGPAEDGAAGLYFFRLALQHEDRVAERLGQPLAALLPPPRAQREAVGVPAARWRLGSEKGAGGEGDENSEGGRSGTGVGVGFVPPGERWAHEVAVPEFEIDAQCINWAQFAEFAEDGGYDRRECWSDAGWDWLQADGRRAPRGVEQLAGSVLVMRGGQLQRAPLQQAAMHVTRHEAEAWCRWAGRRLPTEPEWELAAHTAARRGFGWGDVLEWVAGSARAYPGADGRASPGALDVIGEPSSRHGHEVRPGVLRGCARATPARWRHAKARRFAGPHEDSWLSGFRSCAL